MNRFIPDRPVVVLAVDPTTGNIVKASTNICPDLIIAAAPPAVHENLDGGADMPFNVLPNVEQITDK